MSECRACQGSRGVGLLEYAVVLPVLLLLVLGVMEFSIVFFSYENIANAAREGARAAVVPYPDPAQREAAAVSAVLSRAEPLALTQSNVQFTWDGMAKTVRVDVYYDVHLMSALIIQAIGGNPVIPLHSWSIMHSE